MGKTSIFRCIRGEEFLDDTSKSPYLAEAEIKVKINNTTIKVRNVLLQAKVLVRALSILSCYASRHHTRLFLRDFLLMVKTKMSNNQQYNPPLPILVPSLLNPCARYFFQFSIIIERWSFCFPKLGHMILLCARGFPLDFTKTTIIVLIKSN